MSNDNKEFFYTDFNSLGNIVNTVIQNSNLRQGVKKATVFKFWSKVVGKKFEKHSKIEAINQQNVLIVACANSAVSSELTMFKSDIIKKFNTYANPLDINITDINFSHKIWRHSSQEQEKTTEEITTEEVTTEAPLTEGLEYPICSPMSMARTSPERFVRIRIVSKYISPDSCSCTITPSLFSFFPL